MNATQMGNRIRAARTGCGLTINALADRCNVSERTIIRWENNDNVPLGKYLRDLATALDLDVEWLLYGEPGKEPNGEPTAEAAA